MHPACKGPSPCRLAACCTQSHSPTAPQPSLTDWLTCAVQDVPDLFIVVDVFLVKGLDLVLIARQLVLGDLNDLL
jgi:hypothetical protein